MIQRIFNWLKSRPAQRYRTGNPYRDEPDGQFKSGQLFEIKLKDGSHVVGQILSSERFPLPGLLCAFSTLRSDEFEAGADISSDNVIAVLFTQPDFLVSERWERFGKAEPVDVEHPIDLVALRETSYVGSKTIGAKIVEDFLNAFHGFEPWDGKYYPEYYQDLLLSKAIRPSNPIYKKGAARQ